MADLDGDERTEIERALSAPMEVDAAPLLRAALLRHANGRAELVMAAHHLVIDAVSWLQLADDLTRLAAAHEAGIELALPPPTTSIETWARALVRLAGRIDHGPWLEVVRRPVAARSHQDPRLTGRCDVSVELDEPRSRQLLDAARDWKIRPDELIVTALALSMTEGRGEMTHRIFLEGHGRDAIADSLDVSATVGWFTSLYPAVLTLPGGAPPAAAAQAIRDQLRTRQGSSAEYGILRYLHPDQGVRTSLELDEGAHLLFNYLGRVGADRPTDNAFGLSAPIELVRPAGLASSFAEEVSAVFSAGRLVVSWTSDRHDRAVVAAAAHSLLGHLETVVDACAEDGGVRASPSDFPLAGLDDQGLRDLAAALETAQER